MRARLGQLLRYAGTAGTAAVVDLGGFALLVGAGAPVPPAAAASFLVATVANYLLSARLVFGAAPSARGYARFLIAATAGFAINVGVTVVAIEAGGLPPLAAKAAGIGTAFLANFALNVLFVFARPGGDRPRR